MSSVKNLLLLTRPNNCVKNLIIFSPVFFSGQFHNLFFLKQSFFAFFSFSFITSSIYILNDYMDLSSDRRHPLKKERILASGKVTTNEAKIMFFILLITGLSLTYSITTVSTFYVSLFYVVIMIVYCIEFRKWALIDVSIISIGFVLRLYIGSTATGIQNSMWIIIMTFLLAIFITFAKRRDDLLNHNKSGENSIRESLNGYSLGMINTMINILVPIIIVSYLLYCTSEENMTRVGNNLFLTSVFVLFGFIRYLQLIFVKNLGGDPIKLLFNDFGIQLMLLCWLLSFGWILYP
tara:strand:+ start:19985 stop:20863 length:879 start_codon:yes stop_codon:yes gene_type:complete